MQRRDALRVMVASLAGAIALPFLPKREPPFTGRYFGMQHFDPTEITVPRATDPRTVAKQVLRELHREAQMQGRWPSDLL